MDLNLIPSQTQNTKLKILILGSTGFAGFNITKALLMAGHEVFCGVRDIDKAKHLFPQATIFHCDFFRMHVKENWLNHLNNIDVLINCVGIFSSRNKKNIWSIHYYTPKALFGAAVEMGVKKIIHLSALGIEQYNTEYARSKLAAENYLKSLSIQSIILKPSFIYGRAANGGMALLRGLAILPFIMVLPGGGGQLFQPIHVNNLAEAAKNLAENDFKKSTILHTVSAQKISIKKILLLLRQWLDGGHCLFVNLPLIMLRLFAAIGDFFNASLVNKESVAMLEKGNHTNQEEFEKFKETAGVKPLSFEEGLNTVPSSTQDKLHARLFFFPTLLKLALAFMWFFSAIASAFLYPKANSFQLLQTIGITSVRQPIFLYISCIVNTLIGAWLLMNIKVKLNLILQIVIILAYTLVITIFLPQFWLEPFGPIVKNIPILVSIIMLYFMEES